MSDKTPAQLADEAAELPSQDELNEIARLVTYSGASFEALMRFRAVVLNAEAMRRDSPGKPLASAPPSGAHRLSGQPADDEPQPAPVDLSALLRAADLLVKRADDLWAPGSAPHTEMLADAAELLRAVAAVGNTGEEA